MLPAIESVTQPPAIGIQPESGIALRPRAVVFTSANLRAWGTRSALSLIDQGFTSGAAFGVNVFLARWVPADVYGAFAVAFAGFLFVSGFQNVLLLEPISVFGPSRYADRLPEYFKTQLFIHALLIGVLSTAVILAGLLLRHFSPANALVGATLGGGIALPFMLLLWLARRMCYIMQRPAIAATGSAFYLAFVAVGLLLLKHFGWLGSFAAFALLGGGSLLSSVVLIWLLGILKNWPAPHPVISWRSALKENWTYGRWLVGSVLLFSISSQVQTFLVAASLGLGAAGILRAMQIPSLVMTQVVAATGLLVLPTLSYDFGQGLISRMRHKAVLVSMALLCVTLGFASLLAIEAPMVSHLLFGGKYASQIWLMPILCLIPVANGVAMGFSMALRASQKPRFDLISNLFAAPVAILSAFIFMHIWGLAGAAASMVLSYLVLTTVTLVFFYQFPGDSTPAKDATGLLP
jgi:O-antigen/teichoic acid export membrane protein